MTFELTREDFDSLRLYFEDKRAEILSLARALCEVESPSGDGEGSAAVVNLLAEAAKSVSPSASVERISAPDGYGEHFILRAFDGAGRSPRVRGARRRGVSMRPACTT